MAEEQSSLFGELMAPILDGIRMDLELCGQHSARLLLKHHAGAAEKF
jgi:hypothetical protein